MNTKSRVAWSRPMMAIPALLVFVVAASAGDWPQFRGPSRDDISKETGLLKTWPAQGPRLLWTYQEAGVGYSGPAIVGDRVFLMGARGDTEFAFALDAKTGKEIWNAKVGPKYTWKENQWGDGPRATPTVDGGQVFALGGQGELVCLDAVSGQEQWRKSMPRDLAGEVDPVGGGPDNFGWGYAWAPLVDGQHVICQPGGPQGTLAALDRKTGQVAWRSKGLTDQASYASTVIAEFGGVHQYVQLTDHGVAGVAAKDGSQLWYYKKPQYNDVIIPTPLIHEDMVYITAGWGFGCDLIKISSAAGKFKADKVYANKVMTNRDGGVVLHEGHVYGYSEGKGWVCQELKTGNMTWSEKRALGRGSLTCADGRLTCLSEEEGIVVLAEASPAGWKQHGRFEIPVHTKLRTVSGKVWTHPVIANGRLYLRDQELVFCYDIREAPAQ